MNSKGFRWILIIVILAAWCVPTANAQTDGTPVLYTAGKIYTMTGPVIEQGQVLVADGKIKQVGQSIDVPGDVKSVDLGPGSVLMPGMVLAYTLAGLDQGESAEMSKEITPKLQVADAINWYSVNFKKLHSNGTTTACICPGTDNVISGIACIAKIGESNPQLRLIDKNGPLVASMSSDPARRNQARQRPDSIYVRQPTNRMGVVWMLRSTFEKALDNNQPPMPIIKEALEGKRMMYFVSRKDYDINTVDTLANEFNFAPVIVGGHEAYKKADLLAERKFPVVLTGITTGAIRGPEDTELCWNLAGVLSKSGVSFAFAGEDQLRQARFAYRFGLDPESALSAVTVTPAKMLGIDRRVGSIAPGMDADLVALNGEPLEMTSAIRWVMTGGRITKYTQD